MNSKLYLFLIVGLMACAAPKRDQFQLRMVTQSDDGYSLSGVTVWHGNQKLGTSSHSGKLDVVVEATEGANFDVQFDCPEGYDATRGGASVSLRGTSAMPLEGEAAASSASSAFSMILECQPRKRKAMVVVRTSKANTPIKLGKKVLARSDKHGIAHIPLEFAAKEVFELWLDTTENPLIRPINPEFSFVMPNHDQVFVLQQTLTLLPEPVVAKKRKRRKKRTAESGAVVVAAKRSRPTQIVGTKKVQFGSVGNERKRRR
ncbi:MAG: hypothetical protein GY811_15520 [Myxococcales bacterium]|nr:hypothetical protein [Myxococcales bacterium]